MPSLKTTALQLLHNHLASSTRNTYRSEVRSFSRFCSDHFIDLRQLDRKGIIVFLAHMFEEGLSLSTVRVYLAGVSNFSGTLLSRSCRETCCPTCHQRFPSPTCKKL
ncbi:hypothetical protein RvY_12132 [Ramazzottius varieornatus]|uniref:Core-binding (CB) domain-containing protein n=1 Tax=Ramazzottius varieornatus TaxID=947166 RepID=A0A1D1VNW3_RAMVA|nr:hypothetical protein RvY_12132 [Ramazzottius varieornatus]